MQYRASRSVVGRALGRDACEVVGWHPHRTRGDRMRWRGSTAEAVTGIGASKSRERHFPRSSPDCLLAHSHPSRPVSTHPEPTRPTVIGRRRGAVPHTRVLRALKWPHEVCGGRHSLPISGWPQQLLTRLGGGPQSHPEDRQGSVLPGCSEEGMTPP